MTNTVEKNHSLDLKYLILFLIFIVSGFSGLVYQSIWSHYLGLFLGHAAYAQALVLSIFMGGLALGAALVSRFGARWTRLIRAYGVIELVIGVAGVCFHVVFVQTMELSYTSIIPAFDGGTSVTLIKWGLAALLIFPQTVLLGMTFPLMAGGIIRVYPSHDGRVLGNFYSANSIGAAIGVLAAAFILLPLVGLPGAMLVAGVLNILVGVVALLIDRSVAPERVRHIEQQEAATGDSKTKTLLLIVLGATFLSSAASFVYEVSFIRLLILVVGSTLHAFEIMLAAFIAGIAIGAYWVRNRADRTDHPLVLVSWLQFFMGATALLALWMYTGAFTLIGTLLDSLSQSDTAYTLFNLGTAALAALIMLPTAFFAGATLPLFTVALLRAGHGERSIGKVYAWNTLGAILGVFLAIHFLIPALGLKLTMITGALVDMALGVAILYLVAKKEGGTFRMTAISTGTMVLFVLALVGIQLDPVQMSSGVYREGGRVLDVEREVLFYRDGKTASVSVFHEQSSGTMVITTNGKPDASVRTYEDGPASPDEHTMIIAGILPAAYKTELDEIAIIGFGSGMTTHTALADQELNRVDTLEIEQAMYEGARWFGPLVSRAYEDPRSRVVIDDAKSYFAGRPGNYDAIISEPSNPWISGVGTLFASEFYEELGRYLTDEGVFVQWLQLYEIDERLVGSVLNALLPAVADAEAYLSNTGDLIIVTSLDSRLSEPDFHGLIRKGFQDDLTRIGIDQAEQIEFHALADHRLLRALGRLYNSRANSYYYPVLSLQAPKTRFKKVAATDIMILSVLQYPMLEWLGVREPLPLHVPVPEWNHLLSFSRTSTARSIVGFLKEQSQSFSDENLSDLEDWLLGFAAVPVICAGEELEAARLLIDRLVRLSGHTLSYLPRDGLDGILIDPEWLTCPDIHPAVTLALDLVKANAVRDPFRMEVLGRQWLDSRESLQGLQIESMDAFALASLQFGLVGQGRLIDAAQVEEAYGAEVEPVGDYAFIRTVLSAWLDE